MKVERTVVDIEAEVDDAAECNVLVRRLDRSVRKEESHGQQGADDHGVLPAEELGIAKKSCGHRTEDAGNVGEGVVAPCLELGTVERSPAGLEVCSIVW